MRFSKVKAVVFSGVTLVLLLAVDRLAAQTVAPVPGDTMTLHVTVRELQVAALILDGHRKVVTDIDPHRFRIKIENRKPFPPMRIHRQGDDPFSLFVILDVSHTHRFEPQLADALASLRETALLPHDRLFISAVDCKGIALRADTRAPDAVRKGVHQLLDSDLLHGGSTHGKSGACPTSVHLFDEIAYALNRAATQPGRHALLVVSDGADAGSKYQMRELEEYTTTTATTVFVQPSMDMSGPNVRRSILEPLVLLSGGAVLDEPGKDISRSLASCIAMLRGRFILGFNQPSNLRPGHNDLHVSIEHAYYDIRASGVSTPNEVPPSDKAQPDTPTAQATGSAPQAAK